MSDKDQTGEYNISLNDWMHKFAPLTMWESGRPTSSFDKKFPYFSIDINSAYQKSGVQGAREVLDFYKEMKDKSQEVVKYAEVDNVGDYPDGVIPINIDREDRISSGYERMLRIGNFKFEDKTGKECVWHKHEPNNGQIKVDFWLYKGDNT